MTAANLSQKESCHESAKYFTSKSIGEIPNARQMEAEFFEFV
jgi:hypothetical protein